MAQMDPSAVNMALAVWNSYMQDARRLTEKTSMSSQLEDISDAPSGQELDGAGCGSRSSCQKQVVFM